MFNFFKKKIAESTELQTSQEKEKRDNGGTQIGVGYTITNAAKDMTQAAAKSLQNLLPILEIEQCMIVERQREKQKRTCLKVEIL